MPDLNETEKFPYERAIQTFQFRLVLLSDDRSGGCSGKNWLLRLSCVRSSNEKAIRISGIGRGMDVNRRFEQTTDDRDSGRYYESSSKEDGWTGL